MNLTEYSRGLLKQLILPLVLSLKASHIQQCCIPLHAEQESVVA